MIDLRVCNDRCAELGMVSIRAYTCFRGLRSFLYFIKNTIGLNIETSFYGPSIKNTIGLNIEALLYGSKFLKISMNL